MKKYGRYTILGWTWRTLLGLVLCPVVLFTLLSILIYIPPVQKWAVDTATEYASEAMSMDVKIERVRLRFPLDLALGGMLATANDTLDDGTIHPDTVLNAEELQVSLKLCPLFKGNVVLNGLHLRHASVNTRDLVEACVVRGTVGELSAVSHNTSLTDELAVLDHVLLKDADVNVVMADSVPEDTTTSEPLNWRIDLRDVQVYNTRAALTLAMPQDSDSIQHVPVSVLIGEGKLKGFLDLGREIYRVDQLTLKESAAAYDNLASLTDVGLKLDSVVYCGTGEMKAVVRSLACKDKSGVEIRDTKMRMVMDTTYLSIQKFDLLTSDSRLGMDMHMDFNAFDSINPGKIDAVAHAQIGKGDILSLVRLAGEFSGDSTGMKDVRQMIAQQMPAKPLMLDIKACGNMEAMAVYQCDAKVDGFACLTSAASVDKWNLNARALLNAFGATVSAKAGYAVKDEKYDLNVDVQNLVANRFVKLADICRLTASLKAVGQGLDLNSPKTRADVSANIKECRYGGLDLNRTVAKASLRNRAISGNIDCHVNYSDTTMGASTQGTADFRLAAWQSSRPRAYIDAALDGLSMYIDHDSIMTEDFLLHAETTLDSTIARFTAGDMRVSFKAADNVMVLTNKFGRFATQAERMRKKHKYMDVDELRKYLPVMDARAIAGTHNPLMPIVRSRGINYQRLAANIATSPVTGVMARGFVFDLDMDTVVVDSAYFRVDQDSSRFTYRAAVVCSDQQLFKGFKTYLDGYVERTAADVHLVYYDKNREKGVDLGLHADGANDSVYNIKLYPEVPIIGWREFSLNPDNYICIPKAYGTTPKLKRDSTNIHEFNPNIILADVHLASLKHNSRIELSAEATETGEQMATALIKDLNLGELLSVMPFMPRMEGLINMNASYREDDGAFSVGGDLGVSRFVYEDMKVGDIGTRFNYLPEGTDVHSVSGTLNFNGSDVADVEGKYYAVGDGSLDADLHVTEMPMSIINPFVPDKLVGFSGAAAGTVHIAGPTDKLQYNGAVFAHDIHILSNEYSIDLKMDNDTIKIQDNRLNFENFRIYGPGKNPLSLRGYYDFKDFDNMFMSLSLYGREFKLIESKRAQRKLLFGDVYGDVFTRVNGTLNDLSVRGSINVLSNTNMTYIMSDATISQGDRLEDIVTFVDLTLPPDSTKEHPAVMGIDMNVTVNIEEGAKFNCEFSADRQSYVNVRGGGSLTMTYTPEGVMTLIGRLTVNDGTMKYTLPVIPLKVFNIASGSYVEFKGDMMNPTLNIKATERTKAAVSSSGSTTRSVMFDVGLEITNTLNKMGLLFTIDAPNDIQVQDELATMSEEEKNKLAVALLATGMYISDNNASALDANSALNTFLQSEINAITGRALNSIVDVSMGIDRTTYADGNTGTDYSFKFSKRFLNDRLSVNIGGRVSDNNSANQNTSFGSFIDDVSLEWRLDNSATRYVRLFHSKDYDNVVDGMLEKNGAGFVLRKKVDKFTDLFIFKKKQPVPTTTFGNRTSQTAGNTGQNGNRTPGQRNGLPEQRSTTLDSLRSTPRTPTMKL